MDKTQTALKKSFPTMITPYSENGAVDYTAVKRLTKWYWDNGCDGIFASCLSSEIFNLSETESVKIAATVKKTADELSKSDPARAPMTVVASGHVSDNFEDQVRGLNAMAATGVDAVILITNRLDIENTSDEKWIEDAEKLLARLPKTITLGLYECPKPYKRLITPKILNWCLKKGNFKFIKDTCCDIDIIKERLTLLSGSALELYNANAQTLLTSLRLGAAGYCGVMANFQPKLYAWLAHNYESQPQKAEILQSYLALSAFSEELHYPVCAKYHLSELCKLPINTASRVFEDYTLTGYEKSVVHQMKRLSDYFERMINEDCGAF